jgi:hypothetical protein
MGQALRVIARRSRRGTAPCPARRAAAPLRFKWYKGRERWDAVNCGEPDFFAYMIRYRGGIWRGQAWCWTLVTPRGTGDRYNGWETSAHEAKRAVESLIAKLW